MQRRVSKTQARRRDAEAITVLGRQGIGPKAQLVVVQTDDARYVLGVTEHGVSVVDRLPLRPEPSASEEARPPATRTADDAEFDRILAAAALTSAPPAVAPVPELRRRVRHRNDPLRGSILSPDTWRQTAEALRRAR
ncbi:flagellar biosynthetic protein FliO [Microbacterium sp. LCT-H2]|uniref:FliO/MopB family protein n=1 Tax=Microbacterium sp. LCT-H2 TaxID=1914306 RepID=UPI00210D21A7|nr:flagellar biosynthetic protein FliO [Microbacterium sp. LCT-H2]